MANPAQAFVELLNSASLALAEARATTQGGSTGKPDADAADVVAYSINAAITAMERLALLVRRYLISPEASAACSGERPTSMPIVQNEAFRLAAESTATEAEAAAPLLGIAGPRIAATLRRWIKTEALGDAGILAVQADTTSRVLRRKGPRYV